MKVKEVRKGMWMFWCPACNDEHYVYTSHPGETGPRWEFNNKPEAPTFSPSINITTNHPKKARRCHLYITDGFLRYMSDSQHILAGHTVKMEEV